MAANTGMSLSGSVWLSGIVMMWAPAVVLAVTSPVRWIEHLMRDDGATSTAVAHDPELTFIERASLRVAAVAWLAAAIAMVIVVTDEALSQSSQWAGIGVLTVSTVAVGAAVVTGRLRNIASLSN